MSSTESWSSGGLVAPVGGDPPRSADAAYAELLRGLADLIDAGLAEHRSEPVTGAVIDAMLGNFRCIVIACNPESATLSPREVQVAAMVARGLTNRAIATALDISLWTVATHLRRIFAKLGVNNRAEMVALIAWAPEKSKARPNRATSTEAAAGHRPRPTSGRPWHGGTPPSPTEARVPDRS